MHQKTIKNHHKYRYLGSASALAFALTMIAPTQSAFAADGEATLEEVIVTGSRIRQDPLKAKSPVQILTSDDIKESGQVSVADFLQRLPISGSANNRSNNSSGNLGFPPDGSGIGAGSSQIDLRNLTAKRVLVLVDGKRWIRGSSASGVSGAVDLNTIPVGIIKTIEVLQDGASVIYGSDAIAGVVNIKTRDDYDGFRGSAYYGLYEQGDGNTQEYDLSFGAKSDRGRLIVDLSYTKQGAVEARDRAISAFAIPIENLGASSGTPQGRFLFQDGSNLDGLNITPNVGTGPIPTFDPLNPTGPNSDYHNFTINDRFNFSPFNKLLTPSERVNVFIKGEYDITDDITYRAIASFNNRQSVSQAAPEPLFLGPDAGAGFWLDNIVIPANQPFNPFGVQLDASNIVFFGRRPIEAGPRIFEQNVDTWYISNTLDGSVKFGKRNFFWDVTATFAQNQASQVKHGAFNARRISDALGDPDACAAIPGCVPLNFFGGAGTITREMLDFITFTQKDQSRQELFNLLANVSGEVADLPAGPVGIAFGVEYREEIGSFTPDSVVSGGETAGVPASPTAGRVEATEFYGEINIPVLSDMDFVKSFDVNAAVRYSDYNTSGSSTVFKFGAVWQINDDLTFRGNWSEGFRAPNIGELFNTGSRFDSTITDPCDTVANTSVPANCATLGVPADHQQPNSQISVTTGGNPNLTPETSKTFTLGVTYSPADFAESMGLAGITFEVNYYDISVDDTIQAPNASDVLEGCVATLNPLFCDNVTRTGSGTVTRIDGILTNIAGIDTNGLDWSITAETQEGDWGQIRVKWVNTHLFNYTESVLGIDGVPIITERSGTELGSPERAFVKFKSSLFMDWTRNEFTVGLTGRYISGVDEGCGGTTGDFGFFQNCSNGEDGNRLDSVFYADAQFTYTPEALQENVSFTIGVQNFLDETTPLCTTCDLNNFDGTIHQIPGRFFFGRISFKL